MKIKYMIFMLAFVLGASTLFGNTTATDQESNDIVLAYDIQTVDQMLQVDFLVAKVQEYHTATSEVALSPSKKVVAMPNKATKIYVQKPFRSPRDSLNC